MTEPTIANPNQPWWKDLTRYHWWILIIAILGWMFDTMDQRLFVIARKPAMKELVSPQAQVAKKTAEEKTRDEQVRRHIAHFPDKGAQEAAQAALLSGMKGLEAAVTQVGAAAYEEAFNYAVADGKSPDEAAKIAKTAREKTIGKLWFQIGVIYDKVAKTGKAAEKNAQAQTKAQGKNEQEIKELGQTARDQAEAAEFAKALAEAGSSVGTTAPAAATGMAVLQARVRSQGASDEAQAAAFREFQAVMRVRKEGQAAVMSTENFYGSVATSMLLIGWATGGILFGMMGDKWGRAKTMLLTILVYSIFTGLSALSTAWWDFTLYRFLTGAGVGGEFAAGVALVAEVMPSRARPHALGLLQAMASVGNIFGSIISFFVVPLAFTLASGWVLPGWRLVFLVGILPALIVVFALRKLKEPESWLKLKQASLESGAAAPKLGSYREMLTDKRWRYHTLIGVLLAVSGVIGLWGVGFWTPELINDSVTANISLDQQAQMSPEAIDAKKTRMSAIATGLQDGGAIFGILSFSWLAVRIGRRLSFALAFSMALAMTIMVFGFMRQETQIYWMTPLLGFANLAIFGGYTIYFPELYPTRLRSTGVGFCYNVARYLAAIGIFALGGLNLLYAGMGFEQDSFRYAAMTMAMLYLVGIFTLPFAPETKGKPLPE